MPRVIFGFTVNIALIISILLFSGLPIEAKVTINLQPTAEITSEDIYLKQIAEIKAEEPYSTEELGLIKIGSAPLPAQERVIQQNYIIYRLKQWGLTDADLEINGAENITISRAFQKVNSSELYQVAFKTLKTRYPELSEPDLEWQSSAKDNSLILPLGDLELKGEIYQTKSRLSKVRVQISVIVNEKLEKKICLFGYLKTSFPVLITTKALNKTFPINSTDYLIKKVAAEELPQDALASPDYLESRILKRDLPAGTILREAHLKIKPFVEKGEKVSIVARSPYFTVESKGISQEDGLLGEVIKVKNINSSRIISGKVIGENQVSVFLKK